MTYQRVSEAKAYSTNGVKDGMPSSFRDGKIGSFRPSKPEGITRPQGTKVPPPPAKKTA
jgi:hypothetical protein